MKLSIFLLVLSSSLLVVFSHPAKPGAFPKEFYKRQILQPIPGYIPVYIKTDGEPLIKTKSSNPLNLASPKSATPTIEMSKTNNNEKKGEPRMKVIPPIQENIEKETKLFKTKEKYEKTKENLFVKT